MPTNSQIADVEGMNDRFESNWKDGRYLHHPTYNQPGHRTLPNLHMSLLHAAGMPSDRYGDLGASIDQDGPLGELMS